jgi:DNA-binding response OmpR family regulator
VKGAKVLIADADEPHRTAVSRELERHGYETFGVATANDALEVAEQFDVALLSIDLPDSDGLLLCREIRSCPDVVIIVYTGSVETLDQVLALEAGADHCVPQGTGIREVVARINAVQRRVCRHGMDGSPGRDRQEPDQLQTTVDNVRLLIDRSTFMVTRGEREVPMTRKEFELLSFLVERAGENVTRDVLMERVWLDDSGLRTRTLDTHVNNVRRKIGSRDAVSCVRGIGYRFQAT